LPAVATILIILVLVFPYEHKNGYVRPQAVNEVMELANAKLRAVFGMELVALPMVPRPSNSRTAEGRKSIP
jgi:hypothetical protein